VRAQRITTAFIPPPDEIEITITLEEARILRAISVTNMGVPAAVEDFLGRNGFGQKTVKRFLDDLKGALNGAGITLDLSLGDIRNLNQGEKF
jgi:two-component sensor histidine kinase